MFVERNASLTQKRIMMRFLSVSLKWLMSLSPCCPTEQHPTAGCIGFHGPTTAPLIKSDEMMMNYYVTDTDINLSCRPTMFCPGLAWPRHTKPQECEIRGNNPCFVSSSSSRGNHMLCLLPPPPPLVSYFSLSPPSLPFLPEQLSSWAAEQMWTPSHSLRSHSSTFVFLWVFQAE